MWEHLLIINVSDHRSTTSALQFQQNYYCTCRTGSYNRVLKCSACLKRRKCIQFRTCLDNPLSRFLSASPVLISISMRYAKSSVFFSCHLQVNHYPLSGSCPRLVYWVDWRGPGHGALCRGKGIGRDREWCRVTVWARWPYVPVATISAPQKPQNSPVWWITQRWHIILITHRLHTMLDWWSSVHRW